MNIRQIIKALLSPIWEETKENSTPIEIISQSSKIDIHQKAKPHKGESDVTSIPKTGELSKAGIFSVASVSKVNHAASARARPNNPTTQALIDKLTGTIDTN
jgi:hypothetical protein